MDVPTPRDRLPRVNDASGPIVLALICLGMLLAFGPRLLRFVASHKGRETFATVRSAEMTAVMDEAKRYEHRLALTVELDGRTKDVVVNQVLPGSMRGAPSAGSRLVVRVLGDALAVYVVGHAPSEALQAAMDAHGRGGQG